MSKPAFEVDKRGLEKLLARRGKAFAILELVQNAFDEDVTRVCVDIFPIEGSRGYHGIEVTDDAPEGFADLSHAYTLFAESAKKVNPEQRGRFNLGEKLVLACCRRATITTTTGEIHWEGDQRKTGRNRTAAGSVFSGEIRMNRTEAEEAIAAVRSVIVPEGIELTANDIVVEPRTVLKSFGATLPTEVADDEGYLKRTKRRTAVNLYTVRPGQTATIYEMGIPVVETDCPFHIDVQQKVPLNTDRDNVTPAYLRTLRALTLNAAHNLIRDDDAAAVWVDDALESDLLEPEAVDAVITARYGDKRVIRDPSDPEGTKLAMSKGFAVIQPGSFSKRQWATIKDAGAALPAGKVTPSPKPFSEDGEALRLLPPQEWTPGMHRFNRFAYRIATRLLDLRNIHLDIAIEPKWGFAATWGRGGHLTINLAKVGHAFFDNAPGDRQLRLLIHEMGHEMESDHLSSRYHEALCELGARLALIAAEEPEVLSGEF